MPGVMKPYYTSPDGDIYQGDAKTVLSCLPDKSVHCCVIILDNPMIGCYPSKKGE